MRYFKFFLLISLLSSLVYLQGCKKAGDDSNLRLPQILRFSAKPVNPKLFEQTIISWRLSNALNIIITPLIGSISSEGEFAFSPEESIVFILKAANYDGTITKSLLLKVQSRAFFKLNDTLDKKTNNFGLVYLLGSVTNIGNLTGYNVKIEFRGMKDGLIIDTASGFPASLGEILPGASAEFEAVFLHTYSWDSFDEITYILNWLTISIADPFSSNGSLKQ